MKSTLQSGFTMIELIVVIIIIGILATVAIPVYFDLRNEAAEANVRGVAGAISGAAALNYAAHTTGNAAAVTIDNCNDAGSLIHLQGTPPGTGVSYTYNDLAVANGAIATCTVTLNGVGNDPSATFTIIGAS